MALWGFQRFFGGGQLPRLRLYFRCFNFLAFVAILGTIVVPTIFGTDSLLNDGRDYVGIITRTILVYARGIVTGIRSPIFVWTPAKQVNPDGYGQRIEHWKGS